MRLRSFLLGLIGAIAALVLLQGSPVSAADAAVDAKPVSSTFTEDDVTRAMQELKADPNLVGERKTRTLKWKSAEEQKKPEAGELPSWLRWIGDFFSWFGATAKIFVWVVVGLLVAILVVWIVRFVRGVDSRAAAFGMHQAPTHVRDLDIRPESLPDDIGKAALEHWEQGEHRAALSLLYRGLLSRLVHKYAVPIRHSSTEGECRDLALQLLPVECQSYVATLIGTWQRAVYGGNDPQVDSVRRLCAEFSTLDRVAASLIKPRANAEPLLAAGAHR